MFTNKGSEGHMELANGQTTSFDHHPPELDTWSCGFFFVSY